MYSDKWFGIFSVLLLASVFLITLLALEPTTAQSAQDLLAVQAPDLPPSSIADSGPVFQSPFPLFDLAQTATLTAIAVVRSFSPLRVQYVYRAPAAGGGQVSQTVDADAAFVPPGAANLTHVGGNFDTGVADDEIAVIRDLGGGTQCLYIYANPAQGGGQLQAVCNADAVFNQPGVINVAWFGGEFDTSPGAPGAEIAVVRDFGGGMQAGYIYRNPAAGGGQLTVITNVDWAFPPAGATNVLWFTGDFNGTSAGDEVAVVRNFSGTLALFIYANPAAGGGQLQGIINVGPVFMPPGGTNVDWFGGDFDNTSVNDEIGLIRDFGGTKCQYIYANPAAGSAQLGAGLCNADAAFTPPGATNEDWFSGRFE